MIRKIHLEKSQRKQLREKQKIQILKECTKTTLANIIKRMLQFNLEIK
jgi:hypothetical protein